MPAGFRFAAAPAGVKKAGTDRLDLGLIVSDVPCIVAGTTTTNLVCAAPVEITRERLAQGRCSAVLLNSGNANACTGEPGKADALALINAVAGELGIDPGLIIPMSTGVIGNRLPLDRMRAKVPELAAKLSPNRFMDVAKAIMTTDTVPKTIMLTREAGVGTFQIAGLAKGSGMIAPNMATMLSVICADVKVKREQLQRMLKDAVNVTFNCVTIDMDTSTNDTVVVMCGGHEHAPMLESQVDLDLFRDALTEACAALTRQIAFDGEGATKLAVIRVTGATDVEYARRIARTIADSPLVKTAFNGQDPNWGRIMAAAGRAGVVFDPAKADLFLGDVQVVRNGVGVEEDWEARAHKALSQREFLVTLDLHLGQSTAEILTTDFSAEYVRINADYRS